MTNFLLKTCQILSNTFIAFILHDKLLYESYVLRYDHFIMSRESDLPGLVWLTAMCQVI